MTEQEADELVIDTMLAPGFVETLVREMNRHAGQTFQEALGQMLPAVMRLFVEHWRGQGVDMVALEDHEEHLRLYVLSVMNEIVVAKANRVGLSGN